MNWSLVNWKTTGYGVSYIACKIFGSFVPNSASLCDVIADLMLGAGLISTVDKTRVDQIIKAVDALLWKNQMDPETLQPTANPKP